MTTYLKSVSFHRFDNVSDEEIKALISDAKFVNFTKLIDDIATIPGFPTHWLISSIDRDLNGNQRYPKEHGSHRDSKAIDVVPLSLTTTGKLMIVLPVPLNRNMLIQQTFRAVGELKYNSNLPIIAFESDHIHADILHPAGFTYLNKVRSKFDSFVAGLLKGSQNEVTKAMNKAINDGKLMEVYSPFSL